MQVLILLYHYMGGSENLSLYKVIRILVASYLFMTGYGHTAFFLSNQDYSSRRMTRVLVRLNLLSCVLPYAMRTSYMTYYFAPLVSFWFIVVYATMAINNNRNGSHLFLFTKLILSAAFTVSIIRTPGILETCFATLKALFGISWSVYEFRFRVSLDMYMVYIGMLCAVLERHKMYHTLKRKRCGVIATFTFIVCIATFVYLTFQKNYLDIKESYNTWHPYTSILPVLCYVIARNCGSIAHRYHSFLFAWLGRISLETYILQYHIWLTGDTRGVLRTGIWGPWLDFALLTPVFIWISWRVTKATQVLTEWIVPSQPEAHPLAQWMTGYWPVNMVCKALFDFRGRVGLILLGMRLLNMLYN